MLFVDFQISKRFLNNIPFLTSMIISTLELQKLLQNKKADFALIDVRDADELQYGMIPSAHHIPLYEIEKAFGLNEKDFKHKYHFEKPEKKKQIIVYCRTGSRSGVAAAYLERIEYSRVKNYSGSVLEWSRVDPT